MRDRILALLRQLPGNRGVEIRGDAAWLRCPNPDHAQTGRSPPFKVNLGEPYAGSHYCFGCGIHGGWNKTVARLGLPSSARFIVDEVTHDAFSDDDEAEMLGKRRPDRSGNRNVRLSEAWPPDTDWRRVPGWLVSAAGGRMVVAGDGREPLLELPVMVRGKEVGSIECRIRPRDDGRNYINSKSANGWSRDALYPYDLVRSLEPEAVAIVEGARDALVTIANGLPALATLGSNSWSTRCASLVQALSTRIVIVMADPDNAGEKLKSAIWKDLGDSMDVRVIRLPNRIVKTMDGKTKREKLVDPADLNRRRLQRVLDVTGIRYDTADGLERIARALNANLEYIA
jgi:5S rRNA maturation endonuclease (ribonuclease M5)